MEKTVKRLKDYSFNLDQRGNLEIVYHDNDNKFELVVPLRKRAVKALQAFLNKCL